MPIFVKVRMDDQQNQNDANKEVNDVSLDITSGLPTSSLPKVEDSA